MVRPVLQRVRLGAVAMLALAAVAPATMPASAQSPSTASFDLLPADEAWIAVQQPTAERGGAHGVHLVRPDGSGAFFAGASVPGGEQLHPDWSPDGRWIALDANDASGTPDVWIVDTTDWTARLVVACDAPCLWVQEPAWSPDGSRIALQRVTATDVGEQSTVEVVDLASGAIDVVHTGTLGTGAFAPRWSPDGGSLVFEQVALEGDTFLGVSLEVLDLAEPGTARRIIPVERMANNADWSSDGTLIVFSAPAEGGEPGGALSDLWVVAPDGTGLRRVTDVASGGGTAVHPTFTADGTRLVFKLTDPTTGASDAMASILLDGSDLQPLVGNAWAFGWHPRLRPVAEP